MFADAIEQVVNYTVPVRFISRKFKSQNVIPGLATLFFVNDEGCAITCRHVAEAILNAEAINRNYSSFKKERANLVHNKNFKATSKKLEAKYKYNREAIVEELVQFFGIVGEDMSVNVDLHPRYDIALVRFSGFTQKDYRGHAVFAMNCNQLRPGDYLCRVGFPFPEFTDFLYDPTNDRIGWSGETNNIPWFPIDGMFTRTAIDENRICEIELSTPGLRGQSGGPLFDSDGVVYGMQCSTLHLHLGFDMVNQQMNINGESLLVNNQPFLHVGRCVHGDIIKEFLNEKNIKYYVRGEDGTEYEIN